MTIIEKQVSFVRTTETTTPKTPKTSISTNRNKMTTIYVPVSSNSTFSIPTSTSSASARSSTRGRLTTTITTYVPISPTETNSDINIETINIGEAINNLPTTTKIIAGSAVGLLLICVVSYFAFRLRKYQKRKQEEADLETKGSALFSPGRNNQAVFSPPPTPKTPTSPT
jgi:hypothetical protein